MTEPQVLTGLAALVGFDPLDAGFRADPYPHYARLRRDRPVFRSPLNFVMLTRFRDCHFVLHDDRFGYPEGEQVREASMLAAGYESQRNFLFFMNPPDHTRMRSIVRDGLSPRVIHALREYVQRVAGRLLDKALAGGGTFDLIGSYAHSLPFGVICELLGVPEADRPTVMDLAQRYLAGIGPAFAISPEQHKDRDRALIELNSYFGSLAQQRRQKEAEDILSHLVRARDADGMAEEELLGTCVLLFVAGHSTTTNLIGNGALALMRHRDQLERFIKEPELEASAIEELLRYDVPTHMSFRVAREDVTLPDGEVIKNGQQVLIVRASGNRDPEVFPDPDRLDLARPDNRHLSFGTGRHICLGSSLARMQGKVALRTLFDRVPGLELVSDDLEYHENPLIRGLKEMPVAATTAVSRS